jgi:hypothetical protein
VRGLRVRLAYAWMRRASPTRKGPPWAVPPLARFGQALIVVPVLAGLAGAPSARAAGTPTAPDPAPPSAAIPAPAVPPGPDPAPGAVRRPLASRPTAPISRLPGGSGGSAAGTRPAVLGALSPPSSGGSRTRSAGANAPRGEAHGRAARPARAQSHPPRRGVGWHALDPTVAQARALAERTIAVTRGLLVAPDALAARASRRGSVLLLLAALALAVLVASSLSLLRLLARMHEEAWRR